MGHSLGILARTRAALREAGLLEGVGLHRNGRLVTVDADEGAGQEAIVGALREAGLQPCIIKGHGRVQVQG